MAGSYGFGAVVTTRRSFFAALLAPLVARFRPKPKKQLEEWPSTGTVRVVEFWPRNNPYFYFVDAVPFDFKENWERSLRHAEKIMPELIAEAEKDLKFLEGVQWPDPMPRDPDYPDGVILQQEMTLAEARERWPDHSHWRSIQSGQERG
jgi:hypothetical protein